MSQKERDELLDGEDASLFTGNIPISMWRNDDGKAYPIIVMPRKETCWNCCDEPFETEEEVKKYCDRAIAAYTNAIELFQLFKEGKIDHIYYFDSPEKYLEKANEQKDEEKNVKTM